MTTPSEQRFEGPLSALVHTYDFGDAVVWSCNIGDLREVGENPRCRTDTVAPSEAEAWSAAIEHLAAVHGITPLVEETGEAEARVKVAHHLLVEQAEEIGHLRGEVARLRSAGDGAADVETTTEWSITYGGEPVSARGPMPEEDSRRYFEYARDNAPHMEAKLWRRTLTRSAWEVVDR